VKLGVLAAIAALAAAAAWIYVLRARTAPRSHHEPIAIRAERHTAPGKPGTFAISGIVLDDRGQPVGNASVVAGSAITHAAADGTWALALPAGTYRVFARGAGVLAVGALPPSREGDLQTRLPGALDEQLAPALTVNGELHDIELDVVRAATFTGTVIAGTDDAPVAGAIVHALHPGDHDARAPVLGTDTAITGSDGHYELQLAPDVYVLEVAHPNFTTKTTDAHAAVADAPTRVDPWLASECDLDGRAVDANGAAANDGAIELADHQAGFHRAGAIRSDGTFRVTAPAFAEDVRIRAWPWGSAPSAPHAIRCGFLRVAAIVLVVPAATPAITGAIVDDRAARVPLAPIDVTPLDPLDPGQPGFAQQERAGADGTYRVFAEPAGTYRITASAPGRGFASAIASAPGTRTLVLGGTGRIAGVVAGVGDGSMRIDFATCASVAIAPDPHLVPIAGGHYALEGVPACKLALLASRHGQTTRVDVDVKANATTFVDVAFTTQANDKLVRGTAGANAEVTASVGDRVVARVTSDGDGGFELHAPSGAVIESAGARASVGLANVGDEIVELR
jgi:Carboxypeptidase regulatory-like domain